MKRGSENKKAQVTLFIIVAIIIVAGVVAFFLLKDNIKTTQTIPAEIQPVYDFVQNCLKETGENALMKIGEQGGYFFIPESISSIDGRIPYYLYNNQIIIPAKQEIELNIAGFIREELGFCILNFKGFKQQFKITNEFKESEVEIFDNKVKFSLDYPLTITKDEKVYELKSFNIDIPVRLGVINKVSNEVIDEQSLHLESICLSCLYDLGEKYRAHIDMLDYGNSTIFTIIDDNSKINNESYEFSFAVK